MILFFNDSCFLSDEKMLIDLIGDNEKDLIFLFCSFFSFSQTKVKEALVDIHHTYRTLTQSAYRV